MKYGADTGRGARCARCRPFTFAGKMELPCGCLFRGFSTDHPAKKSAESLSPSLSHPDAWTEAHRSLSTSLLSAYDQAWGPTHCLGREGKNKASSVGYCIGSETTDPYGNALGPTSGMGPETCCSSSQRRKQLFSFPAFKCKPPLAQSRV